MAALAAHAAATEGGATAEELASFYGEHVGQASGTGFYSPHSKLERLVEAEDALADVAGQQLRKEKSDTFWTFPLLHNTNQVDEEAMMLEDDGSDADMGEQLAHTKSDDAPVDGGSSDEASLEQADEGEYYSSDVNQSMWEFKTAAALDSSAALCVVKSSSKWSVKGAQTLVGHGLYCEAGQVMTEFFLRKDATNYWWSFKCCKYSSDFETCTTTLTDPQDDQSGSPMSLNLHNVQCPVRNAVSGWEVLATGYKKTQVKYTCCELPSDTTFQVCSNKKTVTRASTKDIGDLESSKLQCGTREAMANWHMTVAGGKYNFEYTCCNIGIVPEHGAARTCTFVGDKHIINFDGQLQQQGGTDVVWLVKSEFVQIQALVNGSIRELAIAGRFMRGHKLMIFDNGSATWDYKIVDKPLEVPGVASIGLMTVGGRSVIQASLPLSVFIETNCTKGEHLDGFISMEEFPGSQSGRCGNNNGWDDDDPVLPFTVPREEKMLTLADFGQDRLHHVQSCHQCGYNFCAKFDLNVPHLPAELVMDTPLNVWGCEGRDFSKYKIYRDSDNGAVYVLEELGKYEVDNPPEQKRSYSSVWGNQAVGTGHARSTLNSPLAWCSRWNSAGQWMNIELMEAKRVEGAYLQARKAGPWGYQWVTKVTFESSNDCKTYTAIDNGKQFDTGIAYGDKTYLVKWSRPIIAKCIRIKVVSWKGHTSMRAGLSTKAIVNYVTKNPPEQSRTYSSVWGNNKIGTGHARSMLNSHQAWSARYNRKNEWMTISLEKEASVRGAVIQGRRWVHQWVTKVSFESSKDCNAYDKVDNGKVYSTKINKMSEKHSELVLFAKPVRAKCIRIKVQAWRGHISMRAALSVGIQSQAELKAWRMKANQIRSLSECDSDVREKANKTCAGLISGGDYMQDFLEICMYDKCFDDNSDADKEDSAIAQAVEAEHEMQFHRLFRMSDTKVSATTARTSCPYAMKLMAIRSQHEQEAAEEAANELDGADNPTSGLPDLVWIGGKFVSGAWKWDDGSNICGFTNWADVKQSRLGKSKPYICMSRKTGKWYACTASQELGFLCEDPKAYGIGSEARPMDTVGSCEEGEQVAMPKSAAEQLQVTDILKGHAGLVWLGGWFVRDHWEWFDGTRVCYTNWDSGEPKAATPNTMICANAATGKWRTCTDFNARHAAVCESASITKRCPAGMMDGAADLGLSEIPLQSHSHYLNYCLYMSKGGEDCHQTCARQVNGVCNPSGMHVLSESENSCRFSVQNFGGIADGANIKTVTTEDRGCTYVDTGMGGTKEMIFSSGTAEATCDSKSSISSWHRVCACDATQDEDYPEKHIMTEGEVAHATGLGYGTQPFVFEFFKAYNEDCTTPEPKDGRSQWGRATPDRTSYYWGHRSNGVFGIDLGKNHLVKGLVTRGVTTPQYLQTFKVRFVVPGGRWTYLDRVFTYDNTNQNVLNFIDFDEPVTARWIHIIPQTWHGWTVLKISANICPLKRNDNQRLSLLETVEAEDADEAMNEDEAMYTSDEAEGEDEMEDAEASGDDDEEMGESAEMRVLTEADDRTVANASSVVDLAGHRRRRRRRAPAPGASNLRRRRNDAWMLTTLEVQPPTGGAAGKIGWSDTKSTNMIAMWPFGQKNESWSLDVKADSDSWGKALWTVRVNGQLIPELTAPRSEEQRDLIGHVSATAGQVSQLRESLIHVDTSHSGVKVSTDSRNGCEDHPYEGISDDAITWDFRMRFTNGGLQQQCIRCESELGGFAKENPEENKRTYSSTWRHAAPGTGLARSQLDSPTSWSTHGSSAGSWMTMELDEVKFVEGVYFQIRKDYPPQRATIVVFEQSSDCNTYYGIDNSKRYPTGLAGEWDPLKTHFVKFEKPVKAKCIKVKVMGWRQHISVRMGLSTKPITDTSYGHNIWLNQENQIVVDLEGAVPRRVTFRRKFDPSMTYPIGIAYIKSEKVLYLYENRSLQDSFIYEKVPNAMPLKQGYLGCFHGADVMQGTISAFSINHDIPWYRPSKELCATMRCPTGYVANENNWNTHCDKTPCNPDTDRAKCCLAAKSCAEYKCPSSTVLKSNAEKVFCTDLNCDKTPHTVCCQSKQLCSDMKCKDTHEHIPYPDQVSCQDLKCADKDHDVCCRRKATCATFSCPATYSQKSDAWKTPCLQTPCSTKNDKDRCCAQAGMCSKYKCPAGMALKANAAKIHCKDASCMNTDYKVCCDPASACSTLHCPVGLILKEDAAALKCAGLKCESSDSKTCCIKPESCEHMTCPAGTTLHGKAKSLFCKGRLCDPKVDKDTCCVLPGRCNSMTCPATYTHKAKASSILCTDRHCKNTDFKLCCAEEGKCTTMKCAHGYVHRPEAKDVFCTGKTCTASDNNRCCVKPDTCDHFACPTGMISKSNAASLHCKDYTCSQVDVNTCCGTPGHCSSFKCPADYSHRHNASATLCADRTCTSTPVDLCCAKDGSCATFTCPKGYQHRNNYKELLCHKEKCGQSAKDVEMCCAPVSKCNSMICPKGKVLKGNAPQLLCKTSPCSGSDADTCCDLEGRCSTMKCPVNMKHKPSASSTLCDDKDCKDTPFSKCCGEDGKCNMYKCPTGYFPNPATRHSHCLGFKCTDADRDKCCLGLPHCGGYSCPAGWTKKDNATKVQCANNPCNDDDKTNCCTEEGKCTSFKCPDKYIHRADAASLFCSDKACVNTAADKCCVEEGKCSSFQCPPTKVLRKDAKLLNCKGFKCLSGVDDNTCCEDRSKCDSDACSSTQMLRGHHERHLCQTTKCTHDDSKECCANKGMCTLFKCPDGFRHRHNASSTRCTDDKCLKTDFNVCCAEEGTCNTYACPASWVRRPNSHETHCKGLVCNTTDTKACCSKVATCGTFTCPTGMTLKPHPLKLNCKGAACTASDTETCCAKEGRCDSMKCPAGWNHRHDAPTTWCDGQTCNTTDYKKCCQEDGHCLTMSCPSGYVHKKNLDGIKCTSWTCQASDRDICCEQNAQCADVICPKPMVLKAAKHTLQCGDKVCNFTDSCGTTGANSSSTCQASSCFWDNGPNHPSYVPKCITNDVHNCCAQPGTCSMMACPDDYLHLHDAHIVPCPDLTCNATNYKSCCVEQNHCRSYKCPEGYDHKSGFEQLFCKGTKCDLRDRDSCCDPVATCDTHVCPNYFVMKENAKKLKCKGRKCKSPDDDAQCCVHEPSCAFYKCPFGMSVKPNAKDLLCDDKDCSSTHFSKCCDERAKCKTLKCKPGFVLRPSEREVACAGTTCTVEADHDLCCDPQANCGSYKCPEPYLPKHKAQKILCRYGQCTDADVHACCATPDSCGHFQCPAGFALKSNARDIPCPAHNCSKADYLKCCGQEGSCGTFHCPAGLTKADNVETATCAGNKCTHDDEDTCCQAAAACSTMTCPSGFSLRPLAPFLFCKGKKCNADVDSATCCAEIGSCSTYKCPDGFAHRYDAPTTKCPGMNCSATGDEINAACCAKAGTCDTFNCTKSYLRKPDIGAVECRESGSCSDADLGVCCDRRAKCSTFKCPSGFGWKDDYQVTFCSGPTCQDSDREVCCEERAPCTKLTCPAGSKAKYNAFCAGAECTKEDEEECCSMSCTSFKCPPGFVNKTDMEGLSCSKVTCGDDDVQTCCDVQGSCSSLDDGFCPAGTVNRGGSAFCAGAQCDEGDKVRCCGGTCSTFACPEGSHVTKADSTGICAGMNCTADKDLAVCCSERATCTGVTCPAETVSRGGSALCQGPTCSPADVDSCCGQPCTEFHCPAGFSYKAGYLNLLCGKTRCDDITDVLSCCDPNLACEAYHCPAGTMNRGAAASCSTQGCTAEDEATCCVSTCSNENYTCPELHVKKRNAESIACKSRFCGETGDDETCCEMRASCSLMECGSGSMPQPDRYCAGAECTPADKPECCQVIAEAAPGPAPCVKTAVHAGEAGTDSSTTTLIGEDEANYKSDDTCYYGWKPHKDCMETFEYEGVTYHGCTDAKHHKPWCYVSNTGLIKEWKDCKPCTTVCKDGWMPDAECKPTFTYNGNVYHGCTNASFSTPWCYKDDEGLRKVWATCSPCQEGEVIMASSAAQYGATTAPTQKPAPTVQPVQEESKRSSSKTLFIVFCIVLLGGALVALVSVAAYSYSRRAAPSDAAVPLAGEEDM